MSLAAHFLFPWNAQKAPSHSSPSRSLCSSQASFTPLHHALCASPKSLPPLSIALFVLLPSLFRPSPSLLIYKRTAGQRLLCPSRQDGVIMVRAVWGGCLMPPRNLVWVTVWGFQRRGQAGVWMVGTVWNSFVEVIYVQCVPLFGDMVLFSQFIDCRLSPAWSPLFVILTCNLFNSYLSVLTLTRFSANAFYYDRNYFLFPIAKV